MDTIKETNLKESYPTKVIERISVLDYLIMTQQYKNKKEKRENNGIYELQ